MAWMRDDIGRDRRRTRWARAVCLLVIVLPVLGILTKEQAERYRLTP